jgi:hypothetical protein
MPRWLACSLGVTPMPPPDVKGRPPVTSQESGPDAQSATITAASVTRGNGKARLPTAYGAVYGPCPGRSWFALSYRCPACGGTHFGRGRETVASGPRRSRCGAMVWLTIARVHRGGAR